MLKTAAFGAIACLTLAAACGGTTTVKTVVETQTLPAAGTDPANPPTTGSTGSETRTARVGDSITLAGLDSGEKMKVTLLSVVNFTPTGEFASQPEAGHKFVAVQIRLTNVGSAVYDDSPSNGSALIDTQDQQFTDTAFESKEPDIGSPTIRSGDSRVGWMTFNVLKSSKLRTFQFALASGFGPEAAEWSLR